jgi:hypothetical protein
VREFYANEGVKLDQIPVKKDQDASGALMGETYELAVDPGRLVALYNKHLALLGPFFKREGNSSWKETYPTLTLIQRSRKDAVTRDAAVVQKEWQSSLRFLKSK